MRGKEKVTWWRRIIDRCAHLLFGERKTSVKRKSPVFVVKQKKIIPTSSTKKIARLKQKESDQKISKNLKIKDDKVVSPFRKLKQGILSGAKFTNIPTSPLARHESNPILEPTKRAWESKAVFNPAAAYKDGKVHIVYRAIGDQDVSMLGYASSQDGVTIDHRSKDPIFSIQDHLRPIIPNHQRTTKARRIVYDSGGGWSGGCEDPRLIFIDEEVYLLYTAFDGWDSIRIAFTKISFDDFIHHRWNWSDRILISPPGQVEKNWVLFPEKINGKFAILHGITPKVHISYAKNLEDLQHDKTLERSVFKKVTRKGVWDNWVRGAGPPPIKTKYGWLLLYHAMDVNDPNRYKLGAMILDEHDPEKILYRSSKPILEPDEIYENRGHKEGVIYSCGAVVIRKELFVYYGGADTVSCVAVANLDHFLKDLITNGAPKLELPDKSKDKTKRTYARRKTISKKSNPVA